jgi:hypothetical protein
LERITALLTTAMALLLLPAPVLTDESTTLQAIMQGLRDNLVEIADGLLTDDLERVERGATGIATHPRIPPEQVQLVTRCRRSNSSTCVCMISPWKLAPPPGRATKLRQLASSRE